jgi:hypothetical protein
MNFFSDQPWKSWDYASKVRNDGYSSNKKEIKTEQIYLLNHICHFQHMIFKFGILKEDYLRTNRIVGFCDPLLRIPGIGLELGTSQT